MQFSAACPRLTPGKGAVQQSGGRNVRATGYGAAVRLERQDLKQEIPFELTQVGAGSSAAGVLPLDFVPSANSMFAHADWGKVAVLFNQRAHRNKRAADRAVSSQISMAAPYSKSELDRTLAAFAHEQIDTLIIAGGDGTIRDVLSRSNRHFGETLPRLVIVPSGKTNALASDLGISTRWTVPETLAALHRWRTVRRRPIEIRYDGETQVRRRGFVFGTGLFVRTTALAQSVHRVGAVDGLGVSLAIAGAAMRALFGTDSNEWRRGEAMTLAYDGHVVERDVFMLLCSTLERMPLGLRPFGPIRSGLKVLTVDAPPRGVALAAPAIAFGSQRKWLRDFGYHHLDTDSFRLRTEGGFVLDGERYPGGDLIISKGAPIDFLVPG
jgi:diacylglycerol kinase family enzyme